MAQPISSPLGGVNLWLQFDRDDFWIDARTRLVSDQFAVVYDDVMFAAETQMRARSEGISPRVTVCWLALAPTPPVGIFYEPPREALERCRGVWEVAQLVRRNGFSRDWIITKRPRRRPSARPHLRA